jgi:hypothetical protein
MKDVHKISLAEYEERVDMVSANESMDAADYMQHEQEEPLVVPIEMAKPVTYSSGTSSKVVPNLVDNGNHPSRWNRCRFKCAICHKLSSEKRHIREHVVKAHGLAMPDYEAQYGDCEIHTEVKQRSLLRYCLMAWLYQQIMYNLK